MQLEAYFAELHGICSYRANRSQFVFVLLNLMAKEGAIKGIILVSIFLTALVGMLVRIVVEALADWQ